jgi:type I restriction enzyme S subunit
MKIIKLSIIFTFKLGKTLSFYFKTPQLIEQFRRFSQGLVKDTLNLKYPAFAQISAPVPPYPEQQKIAECLSSVDKLMAAQARKVDALKTHKKGLMQQLFPRRNENSELRSEKTEPNSSFSIQNSNFSIPSLRFPEFQNAGEWEPKTLVDACRMQAGKFVAAADIKEQNAGDLFPCYGGNGLRGFTATHTHDGVYPLIGRQGALCGNIKLASDRFHATEHAVVAKPNQGVDVVWLYYLLDLLNLNRFATGQAQPGLSVDVLEKVPVTIPKDESEQQHIATCLSSLDALITAETQKHEALKTHKKGLMQQLFPSPDSNQ